MLTRVALLLLWVTIALGQTAVEIRPADAVRYRRLIRAELPLYPPPPGQPISVEPSKSK